MPRLIWVFDGRNGHFCSFGHEAAQMLNLRILCEKYLQHQQNLYHVFKNAFKWYGMKAYGHLWGNSRSYESLKICMTRPNVQFCSMTAQETGSITEGVWQGCLLSPTPFDIFLERIMCETLDDHEGSVSIGGGGAAYYQFPLADDIVVKKEAVVLIDRLDTITARYKIEIGPDKAKVMPNNPNGFQTDQDKWSETRSSREFQVPGMSLLMMDPNPEIFFPGLPKRQQLYLDWRSYGGTRSSRLLLRLSWCWHLSYPPSLCMWELDFDKNSKEGSKPLRCDDIGDLWTFPANITWRARRLTAESVMQLEYVMISSPWWRNGNSYGMATSQYLLAWWRQFCTGHWKEQEGEEDGRRYGKIASKDEQESCFEIPWG